MDGAADWNRTSDPVLTKDVLYRLSYGSEKAGPGADRARNVPQAARGRKLGPLPRTRLKAVRYGLESGGVALDHVAMSDAERKDDERADRPERAERSGKAERLVERLRDNLRRRKLQARGRREAPPEDGRT